MLRIPEPTQSWYRIPPHPTLPTLPRPLRVGKSPSKRQLCVLAAVAGCLLVAESRASNPELRHRIRVAAQTVTNATAGWNVVDDGPGVLAYAYDAISKFDALLGDKVPITGSIALALHLLTDLDELISNRLNRRLAGGCFGPIQTAYDWLDERGANWPAIEWAEGKARVLYGIIGEA